VIHPTLRATLRFAPVAVVASLRQKVGRVAISVAARQGNPVRLR